MPSPSYLAQVRKIGQRLDGAHARGSRAKDGDAVVVVPGQGRSFGKDEALD